MLGSGIVAPLMPIYARDFGATGFLIGFIFASFSLSRSAFLPYFSRLSDRRGRRGVLLAGLSLHLACSIGYVYADSIIGLTLVRLVHGGSAAMIWPIATAYVGDITPPGQEGRYMGILNVGVFGGLAGGPFLGGLIKDALGMSAAFLAMGAITLLGLLLAIVFLPGQEPHRAKPPAAPPKTIKLLRTNPVVRAVFIFRLLTAVTVAASWAFQPLYLDTVLHLSASVIGMLISLNVALSALLQPIMGRVADRLSRRDMILAAGVIQTAALALLPLARSLPELLAVNLGVGLAGGIAAPALQAVVTDLGRDAKMMGTIMGSVFTAQSVGMLIGPILAGSLFQFGQFGMIFWSNAALVILGLIPIYRRLARINPVSGVDRPTK